jgi:hypothetical protein
MRFRKLRIAWSVAWGVAAVLLVVLWVRSFGVYDGFTKFDGNSYSTSFGSVHGVILLHKELELPSVFGVGDPQLHTRKPHGWRYASSKNDGAFDLSFNWDSGRNYWVLVIPIWFLVGMCASFAIAPWLRRRYSLRTLLIATTVVALVLGVIVYAVRS